MKILHLYISAAHTYFGHHGKEPGTDPMVEVDQVECVENRGIKGDRFFDHKQDYKGQITFFSKEIYDKLCDQFGVDDKAPTAFRRNVIVEGIDLNSLIGEEFEIQGVRFLGTEECKPCYWMDQAFADGAHEALKGNGGLRARILTDGILGKES
ncbi:MAG: MOSC domain-containing protein [Verrucomicrobiota bacterium]